MVKIFSWWRSRRANTDDNEEMKNERLCNDTLRFDGGLQRQSRACDHEQPGTDNYGKRADPVRLFQQHLHIYLRH